MNSLEIQQNLYNIRQRIEKAASVYDRNSKEIQLVAVSKFHPITAVQAALSHNQFIFGENRIQEAKEKFTPLLEINPDIRLHIIGPIQTNKIIDAVKIANVIETIDRVALLDPLQKAIDKTGRCPKLFIQINVGQEPQKAGIMPSEANDFIETCIKKFGKKIQGIMGIPPVEQNPTPYFQQLTSFARQYHLPEISMGMSADFEQAIACGATLVRVGSAIFGNRPPKL
ncbi:YggS family pyridoxal phosphate-dependent enzyme [Commensalibacter papalotli (ex Botero et al. 2024)]|uniref:Pyridoxal phosphate homeostasis protein n=1 Tax=Commensalibacter papalotli (ex Botero et al. 2024) TaxID=2972766 RepID=A0ABM9HLA7_9PROT|nr:YggS family pyridoxal phosphate-dependent enzyme [Commensalibacter papalotli (ex Botero et al. 2024)]CAI3933279.1 Pyridoxal 5'-phosphate homeostasis protein YggS [Commensalibacter papalotli (ex Botero et al. 2024)]CAI3949284.1 Pyridoxal 5'-phosphate homeostasis protein YggS [Commensalibacter papalotli (ex Botero et al. 2024)]